MILNMLSQFTIILPEIMMALLAISMQLFALFYKKHIDKIVSITIILGIFIVCYLFNSISSYKFISDYIFVLSNDYDLYFASSFMISSATYFAKGVILIFSLINILIYRAFARNNQENIKMEFITLLLLSTLGIFIAISSHDFILLFCGLELQAISGYVLAAFNRKNSKSSEAGLKYFVLGSLMSALMLLGISFIYGFSGKINFTEVNFILTSKLNIGLIIGVVFVFINILFKFSAAPFHMWTPDVYEGAPVSSVTYFATVQKLGTLFILINIMHNVIGDYYQISNNFNNIIKVTAIISMIIGALGAIKQVYLKRLMAYSTILNVGYILVALSSLNSVIGFSAAFIYMLIYITSVIGFFSCLIAAFGKKADEATFNDLRSIASGRKIIAASMTIITFSMIGIPPLAGFFAKYYIFYSAFIGGERLIAILASLISVASAFYYLKIIKYIYFMNHNDNIDCTKIPVNRSLQLIITFTVIIVVFFSVFTFV